MCGGRGTGAVLGPLCDGRHSTHDVLHYANPTLMSLGAFHLECVPRPA